MYLLPMRLLPIDRFIPLGCVVPGAEFQTGRAREQERPVPALRVVISAQRVGFPGIRNKVCFHSHHLIIR